MHRLISFALLASLVVACGRKPPQLPAGEMPPVSVDAEVDEEPYNPFAHCWLYSFDLVATTPNSPVEMPFRGRQKMSIYIDGPPPVYFEPPPKSVYLRSVSWKNTWIAEITFLTYSEKVIASYRRGEGWAVNWKLDISGSIRSDAGKLFVDVIVWGSGTKPAGKPEVRATTEVYLCPAPPVWEEPEQPAELEPLPGPDAGGAEGEDVPGIEPPDEECGVGGC